MKNKLAVLMILLGVLLILGALGLLWHNQQEQQQAAQAVDELMPQMVEMIHQRHETLPEETLPQEDAPPEAPILPPQKQLPVVEIDGYGYIGFVGIPALGLELPVMADWSYPQLKKSPCRFSGDLYSDDLVIMAHNYQRHFGSLEKLRAGDTVTFTDMDGVTTQYTVVALDVLAPTAVEEMTAGEFDLTLFTCTYGGKSRVTVRCDKIA